ncbi:MAG TPA: hypothetical protein VF682_26430 [Pseudomonas sp.]|jgi:hypothetical protein
MKSNLVSGIAAVPIIARVTDSKNTPIPNPGTTQDTALTLSGTATANVVLVLSDDLSIIGTTSVTTAGTWEKSVTAAVGRHSYTAREQGGVESQAWVITVVNAAVKPVIVSVADSKGVAIPPNGNTSDTSVTLAGTAEPNSTVEIDDGTTSWGTAPAPGGTWTKALAGLQLGPHSMTAVTGADVSDPWPFTVMAEVQPVITTVSDSSGEVVDGGTTFDTSVTLAGKAAASQRVEIFDGATSKGTANVNASGDWTLSLTGLSVASHSITAKGLYGSNPVSAPRTFNVAAATTPTITSVRDSKGEVANGGTTFDTSVTLAGKAAASQRVEIFDGATSKGTANVNANGDWTLQLTGLSVASHSITAKALYGSNPVSAARTFSVRSELSLDTSPVTLAGLVYVWVEGHPLPSVLHAGTSILRTASGGSPPYTYRSSNAAVAPVDSSGLVRARGNGTVTITASDSGGNSKSYQVTVTNVWRIEYIGDFIHRGALEYQRPGGHLPSGDELQGIRVHYGASWPHGERAWWSADVKGVDALAVNIPSGGSFFTLKAFAFASLSVYR